MISAAGLGGPHGSKVVAVANQKGGVGKTTTAVNLSASLALSGRRVLLIDLDPQGNATSGLGLKGKDPGSATLYEVLNDEGAQLAGLVRPTSVEGLFLVPADRHLAAAEIELIGAPRREYRVATLVASIRGDYEFIVIDCPPSLGLLTLNALVAADSLLIPLNCEYFALEGLADLVETLGRVRAGLNPELHIEGVLLTMSDDRTNLGQQVGRDVREFFGDRVYRTVIPRNIKLAEAPSHGQPAVCYDARSRGAEAYIQLAGEFLERNRRSLSFGS